MFEFTQQLEQPLNSFQNITFESQKYQQKVNNSHQTIVISNQGHTRCQNYAQYDQTQQKKQKKDKLSDKVKDCHQIELYDKLIEEQQFEQEKYDCSQQKQDFKLLSKEFLICQNVNINKQFIDHVQIQYGNFQIDDQVFKNKLISDIIGQINDVQDHKDLQIESIKQEQNISRQNSIIQHLYDRKEAEYSVSIKTSISQDGKKFIVQKILEKPAKLTQEEFENQIEFEIGILKYINSTKTQITLPFIKEEILKESNQTKICILYIDSGIKNLDQIKNQFIANKNYEEYNKILELAFCQLLKKLNKLHSVCKIAHSDIKPGNLVVGYDLKFYFIDFGASIYLDNESSRNSYLQSYTRGFNLKNFLKKRQEKLWKYQDIIDCEVAQLILSFLYLIDVGDEKDRYYLSLLDLQNSEQKILEDCRNKIKPEFKRLGKYLLKSLLFIIQKQNEFNITPLKQKVFLFTDYAGQLTKTISNLYDIKYNQEYQHYEVISINIFSIQIIEIIIQNDPQCKFLINEKTQIDYTLNKKNNNTIDGKKKNQRDISNYPMFCEFFQLINQKTSYIFQM
ncbi:hypothetical protein ABPG74_003161 [Tetrahymena malaccensis]